MQNLSVVGGAAVVNNPLAVYLSSLSASGRRTMASKLKAVASILGTSLDRLPWHELRHQHIATIKTKLQESGKAPSTVNATLAALRGVARAAFNLGVMSADNYARIRDVRPVRYYRLPAGRNVPMGELSALMDACITDKTPAGARDAALIAVMYACGLRRSEIAGLDVTDYANDTVSVRGKGDKQREVPIINGAALALNDWLSLRGAWSGPMFCPVSQTGEVRARSMTSQAIYNALRKRANEAGVAALSPHDLRRSCCTDLLETTGDVLVVQKILGHANTQTTARYDRRGEHAKRKAVGTLCVPYRRR